MAAAGLDYGRGLAEITMETFGGDLPGADDSLEPDPENEHMVVGKDSPALQ